MSATYSCDRCKHPDPEYKFYPNYPYPRSRSAYVTGYQNVPAQTGIARDFNLELDLCEDCRNEYEALMHKYLGRQ